MKAGGGARKGGAFERKCARMLSSWYYNSPEYLWRRSGNGNIKSIGGRRHTGDIVPLADSPLPSPFPFHIQLKHLRKKDLKLDKLLTSKNHPIVKIWNKEYEEKRSDLKLMLLVRANNTPIMVVVDLNSFYIDLPDNIPRTVIPIDDKLLAVMPWESVKDAIRSSC